MVNLPLCPDAEENNTDCFSCQRRHLAEWCVLKLEDMTLLDDNRHPHVYEIGDILFRQGDECKGVYSIESGVVALRKIDSEGNSIVTKLVEPGQTLGYRALLANDEHSDDAEVVSPARVSFISRDTVSQLIQRNPAIGLRFAQRLAIDLRKAEDLHMHSATLPVRSRLAHLLLTLRDRFAEEPSNEDGSTTIRLPLSRQDMAAMIGTRPETISRTIRRMQQDEVALFKGRTVIVPDMENLLDEVSPDNFL